jgi:hypothetical protein
MNAAVPSKSNLNLRLEHQFQTAMTRQRGARPQFRSSAHGMAQYRSSGFLRHWHAHCARSSGCPHPRGHSAALRRHRHHVCREHDFQQDMVPERFESHIRLAPVIFLGEPIPADNYCVCRMP